MTNILDPDHFRPDVLLGLIWVQTVRRGNQQTALPGKDLKTKKFN